MVTRIDTAAAALLLEVKPATVRWYAHTGRLTECGTAQRRRLYDLDEVVRLAEARKIDFDANITNTSMQAAQLCPSASTERSGPSS